MALPGEADQRSAHALERLCLAAELFGMGQRQGLYFAARAITIDPQREKGGNLIGREPEVARIGDKPQPVDFHFAVVPVTTVAPPWRWDKADLFVVPDHPLRNAARPGRLADVHNVTRLRRRAFVITLTEDSAIAAAAIIGESRSPNSG